ncbi:MAG: FkbM family methyltransferase [Bacteroidota bacterium]
MKTFIRRLLRFFSVEARVDYYRFNQKTSLEVHPLEPFYRNLVKPNSLVFDVGANIGDFSDLFLKNNCRVIAAEPQKYCRQYLHIRFRKNKNFILVPKAVSEKEGKHEIFVSDNHTVSSLSKHWIEQVKETERFGKAQWNKAGEISTITLDQLIGSHGCPDYCKIDVEGFELNVIKGLSKKIPFISFEFTTEAFSDTLKIIEHLSSIGAYQFNVLHGGEIEFVKNDWLDKEAFLTRIEYCSTGRNNGDIFARLKS